MYFYIANMSPWRFWYAFSIHAYKDIIIIHAVLGMYLLRLCNVLCTTRAISFRGYPIWRFHFLLLLCVRFHLLVLMYVLLERFHLLLCTSFLLRGCNPPVGQPYSVLLLFLLLLLFFSTLCLCCVLDWIGLDWIGLDWIGLDFSTLCLCCV